MKSKKSKKKDNIKPTKKTEKTHQNPKVIVISLIVAVLVVASCILLALKLNKPQESDPNALNLEGEWMDIMTNSSLKFEGENFYLDSDGPYRFRYDETKQTIYLEYRGGDIKTLKCNYVDGYWKLTTSEDGRSYSYVPVSKRDELRVQAIAEKWAAHTKDRTAVILGQEYTTANGITFTITSGEMRNTPDVVDATAVINLYIDCSVDIDATNWVQSEVRTPADRSYGNTEFDLGADVTFWQNINGVTELGKEPYDYCIMQFEFGGTKYYLDLLTLNLIAE